MATADSSTVCQRGDTVPVDLSQAESHSWEYGERCVCQEGQHRETWSSGRQSIAVFDVTEHTVVLRVETPVGRQSFYGMADRDYRRARERLVDARAWTATDK